MIRWAVVLKRGADTMLAVYVIMIHKGLIELKQVPLGSCEKVAAVLEVGEMYQNEISCNRRSDIGALFLCLISDHLTTYKLSRIDLITT